MTDPTTPTPLTEDEARALGFALIAEAPDSMSLRDLRACFEHLREGGAPRTPLEHLALEQVRPWTNQTPDYWEDLGNRLDAVQASAPGRAGIYSQAALGLRLYAVLLREKEGRS